jgi:tRNA G18 (ribose-2'-O)-methylase SpoU
MAPEAPYDPAVQTPIEDADDSRLSAYHALRAKSQRADSVRFVAESETVIRRLLSSTFPVESVLATPSRAERLEPLIPDGCPLYVAPRALLREIVGYDLHRGAIAAGVRPALGQLPELPAQGPLRIVVAQGLSDPANVGALIRNCRAFAIDVLVLDPKGADPLTPRAVRASMGNVFTLPFALCDPLAAVSELRANGVEILAATVRPNAEPIENVTPGDRWALLVGNEGSGLSAPLLECAGREITIPIAPDADSLNVAAASAVLLYHLS